MGRVTRAARAAVSIKEVKETLVDMIKCVICRKHAEACSTMANYCVVCSMEKGLRMCLACHEKWQNTHKAEKKRCPTHNTHNYVGSFGRGSCFLVNKEDKKVYCGPLAYKTRLMFGEPCINAGNGCKARFLDDLEKAEHVCACDEMCSKCNKPYTGSETTHLLKQCTGYACPVTSCSGKGARHVFWCEKFAQVRTLLNDNCLVRKEVKRLKDSYAFLFTEEATRAELHSYHSHVCELQLEEYSSCSDCSYETDSE